MTPTILSRFESGSRRPPGILPFGRSVAGLFLFLLTLAAEAQEIGVSNLANNPGAGWITGANGAVGNRFDTGAGPGWRLDTVTLSLSKDGLPPFDFEVSLFAADGSGGFPGTQIGASFTGENGAGISSFAAPYVFTPQTLTELQPSTSYWIVTDADGDVAEGDFYIWTNTMDLTETGLAGWSIGDVPATNSDGPWEDLTVSFDEPVLFEVEVTTIPEPELAAPALALLAAAGLRRRRISITRQGLFTH